MKKTIINFCGIKIVMRVFLLLFFTILTSSSIAQITYGIYNNSTRTFTIGYGATLPTNAVEINCERGECIIPYYNVEKIIIEKSFAEYKPTTCRNWFYNCWELKSIEGLENINTQDVRYMSNMFQYCSNLESLDLSNFKTDNVVSMDTMFCYCVKLTSLDLSSFKTDNVTNMSGMFYDCSNLTSLDLSVFKTDNVTNMSGMFRYCNHLKAIFVSDKWSTKSVTKFNYIFAGCKVLYGEKGTHCESNDIKYACIDEGETKPGYFTRIGNEIYIPIVPYGVYDSNNKTLTIGYGEIPENADEINTKIDYYDGWIGSGVRSCYNNNVEKIIIEKSFADCKITTCRCWFYGCNRLVEIEGLGNVNTQEVTDMSSMFSSCYSLTSLDLSKFNTSAVTDMSGMFSYCNHLICVFVSDKWTTKSVKKSDNIFYNCWRLYGEKETNNEGDDIKFARIDGGKENPGYFTRSGNTPYYPELFPYGIYDSKIRTLTIGYGKIPENAVEINTKFYGGWIGNEVPSCYNNNVEKIVFEKSFADYKPTTCRNWFYGCEYLKSIEGIENINTVAVTDMSWMFYECRNLTSLDLSNFNTAAVTDMSRMFDFCRNLSILDFSSFNTENTINMSCMFHYCSSITNLDLKNFNTVNVTNMTGMFMECSKLTSLDISNFKTDNVVLIDSMFYGLSVNALDLSNFKTDKVTSMREMFSGCDNLTELDLSSFKTDKVTSMRSMFSGCDNLTELDLSSFKTDKVTSMRSMFSGCYNLTELDLSNFKTDNVADMSWMFATCNQLQTVYVSSKWTTKSATKTGSPSYNLFYNTENLIGEKGTRFISDDIKYARIDEGEANPGYFTRKEKQVAEQIKMLTLPKIEYWDGENFSVDNGTFEVIFNYGDNQVVDLSEATISGFDSKIVGEQTITVSYLDLTTDFQVTVNSKNPYTKPELKDNFYQISNALELLWFMYDVNNGDVNSNAVLVINIVINEDCLERIKQMLGLSKEATEIVEWQPIGTVENAYNGIFDGQGHTISGIYVNQTEKSDVGLFGAITSDAVIKNLGIVDSYISGKENVGAICGSNDGAIVNCYSLATTVSTDASSGIAGEVSENGIVENSYYLAENPNVGDSHAKTLEQFKNGEVAELLSKGTSIAGVDYSGDAFAGVVDLTGSDEQTNTEDPKTPVSEAIAKKDAKIWAFNKTIIVENASTEIYIVNSLGKQIVSKYPTSNHEEITISNSGVYIVKVGLITQKVFIE